MNKMSKLVHGRSLIKKKSKKQNNKKCQNRMKKNPENKFKKKKENIYINNELMHIIALILILESFKMYHFSPTFGDF
jgi:uncharacterized membrane protein YkgB